jgi:hypothetical protein
MPQTVSKIEFGALNLPFPRQEAKENHEMKFGMTSANVNPKTPSRAPESNSAHA